MSDDLKLTASEWQEPTEVTYRNRRKNPVTVWTVRRPGGHRTPDPASRSQVWVYHRKVIQIPEGLAQRLVQEGAAALDEEGVLHFLPWTARTTPPDPAPWQVFQ